jgi:hypothetical protein
MTTDFKPSESPAWKGIFGRVAKFFRPGKSLQAAKSIETDVTQLLQRQVTGTGRIGGKTQGMASWEEAALTPPDPNIWRHEVGEVLKPQTTMTSRELARISPSVTTRQAMEGRAAVTDLPPDITGGFRMSAAELAQIPSQGGGREVMKRLGVSPLIAPADLTRGANLGTQFKGQLIAPANLPRSTSHVKVTRVSIPSQAQKRLEESSHRLRADQESLWSAMSNGGKGHLRRK